MVFAHPVVPRRLQLPPQRVLRPRASQRLDQLSYDGQFVRVYGRQRPHRAAPRRPHEQRRHKPLESALLPGPADAHLAQRGREVYRSVGRVVLPRDIAYRERHEPGELADEPEEVRGVREGDVGERQLRIGREKSRKRAGEVVVYRA